MTTCEAIYRTALEHIRDGSDAVCTECGWMGSVLYFANPYSSCPECGNAELAIGYNEIAAYALAQGEKGE